MNRALLAFGMTVALLAPATRATESPESGAAPAEVQPQAAPGEAKYIVVLETKKGSQRPDFAASGATVDAEWGNRVAIRIPEQAIEGRSK